MINNYYFHSDEIISLGYKTLSILYSYYEFDKLYREAPLDQKFRDPDVVDELRIYEDEILKNYLLKLAALARACDDTNRYLSNADKVFPTGVGVLHENGKEKKLLPREACNKIIHAKSACIIYNTTKTNPLWGGYLETNQSSSIQSYAQPILRAEGTRKEINWEVEIYLVQYIFAVSIENITSWNLSGNN